MAKKPGTNPKGEFAFFNVFYEDGSQRSNRRVPSELLGDSMAMSRPKPPSPSRTARSPKSPAVRRWRSRASSAWARRRSREFFFFFFGVLPTVFHSGAMSFSQCIGTILVLPVILTTCVGIPDMRGRRRQTTFNCFQQLERSPCEVRPQVFDQITS